MILLLSQAIFPIALNVWSTTSGCCVSMQFNIHGIYPSSTHNCRASSVMNKNSYGIWVNIVYIIYEYNYVHIKLSLLLALDLTHQIYIFQQLIQGEFPLSLNHFLENVVLAMAKSSVFLRLENYLKIKQDGYEKDNNNICVSS